MARKAIYKHATQVNVNTHPDDGTSPVGSTEWNEDPAPQGMYGNTPPTSTIAIASGVATPTDSVTVVTAESSTTDTLDKLAITNTSEYDLIYLFGNTGHTITLTHTASPSADGHISTVGGANETLSTTKPTILMRKGAYWYGYGGGTVADGSITTAKIAANAVDGTKIAMTSDATGDTIYYDGTNYVRLAKGSANEVLQINSGATAPEWGAVAATEIAANAVDTSELNADAVTGAKIADDAIDSEHYTDASIDLAHLAADSVDGSKIADDAINSEHYAAGSIDTAHIADDQVTGAKIENAVTIATSATSPLMVATTSARITQVAITSSSNATAWDAAAAANAYYVTSENTTFAAPSNATEGAIISVEIAQGGTARTVAWNTIFEFAASTAPTITATASKTDILTFRYNGSIWQEIGRVQNMAQT